MTLDEVSFKHSFESSNKNPTPYKNIPAHKSCCFLFIYLDTLIQKFEPSEVHLKKHKVLQYNFDFVEDGCERESGFFSFVFFF